MRCLNANSYSRNLLTVILFCSSFLAVGRAQQVPMQPRPVPTLPGQAPTTGDENANSDVMTRRAMTQQAERRNVQRQQDIVNDTAKLLTLAEQLKEEVDKSSKNQLSVSVVKKAEEIEKLAKSVKEKMKGN
jgi:hypothetical protein